MTERIIGDLLRSSEQTKAVVETFPEPLFILDKNGKITNINKSAEDATGFSRNELEGKSIDSILSGKKDLDTVQKKEKPIKYIPDPDQE